MLIEREIEMMKMEQKTVIIKGYCQSGKTNIMLARTIINTIKGITSVISLRSARGDQTQLRERISDLNKKVREDAKSYGFSVDNFLPVITAKSLRKMNRRRKKALLRARRLVSF